MPKVAIGNIARLSISRTAAAAAATAEEIAVQSIADRDRRYPPQQRAKLMR